MVREFEYTSNNGTTRTRKVFVMKDTQRYLEGIDLSLLSDEEANTITSMYKDVLPATDGDDKLVLEGFNPAWNKAYRQYVKCKIKS